MSNAEITFVLTGPRGPRGEDSEDAAASAAAARADRLLADADVVLTHADVQLTHADVVEADAAADVASNAAALAAALALGAGFYANGAATNVPKHIADVVGAITPGSGGTNGTFALAWTGGNFSILPTGTFTVAGGVLTSVTISGGGLYIGASPTAPTPSFAASAGLSGAGVVLTVEFIPHSGQAYYVASSDGTYYQLYRNNAGTPLIVPGSIWPGITGPHELSSVASSDGLAYTATGPSWIAAITAGMFFLFRPNVTSAGLVNLNINGIGAKGLTDAAGTGLMQGMLAAGQAYLIHAVSSVALQLVDLAKVQAQYDQQILHNLSGNDGTTDKWRITRSGNGEMILSSWVSGALVEVGRFDTTTGALRALFDVRVGSTAGSAVSVFTPLNPPEYIADDANAYVVAQTATNSLAIRKPEDVDPSTFNTTVPYCVSYGDIGRTLHVEHSNVFLDLQKMPIGVPLNIAVGTTPGWTVNLYCGPGATWDGQSPFDLTLTYPASARIEVYRYNATRYIARAITGIIQSFSSAPAPARDVTIITAGQSLSVQLWDEAGLAGFQAFDRTRSVWPITGGLGSSCLLKSTDDLSGATGNYWWNDQSDTPGPRCTDFATAVAAAVALGQPVPALILWDQGEAEYFYIQATGPITPATFYATLVKVFANLRSNPGMSAVPIVICPLGASDNSQNPGGYLAIREAECAAAANLTNVHMGHEKYDLTRKMRNPHLDFVGQIEEGRRFALVVNNLLFGGSNDLGPSIVAFTEIDHFNFAIDITAGTLFRPGSTQGLEGQPIGFALLPSSDPLGTPIDWIKSQWSVTGGGLNRLTLTTAVDAHGCRLAYPYGSMQEMRTGRIVADFFTFLPLRAWPGA